MTLFVDPFEVFARAGENLIQVAARELAVVKVEGVARHVEIDRAIGFVGIAVCENLFDHLDLLGNMARSPRLDVGAQHVQGAQVFDVGIVIMLGDLHGFELFQPGALFDLAVALVGIVFQVAYIGDVAHIANFVAAVFEVTVDDVEGEGRAGVAQVGIAIDGGTTDVHSHERGLEGFEDFFFSCEGIVNDQ